MGEEKDGKEGGGKVPSDACVFKPDIMQNSVSKKVLMMYGIGHPGLVYQTTGGHTTLEYCYE